VCLVVFFFREFSCGLVVPVLGRERLEPLNHTQSHERRRSQTTKHTKHTKKNTSRGPRGHPPYRSGFRLFRSALLFNPKSKIQGWSRVEDRGDTLPTGRVSAIGAPLQSKIQNPRLLTSRGPRGHPPYRSGFRLLRSALLFNPKSKIQNAVKDAI